MHIFISYSHMNITERKYLQAVLKEIGFEGDKVWSDNAIEPGDMWLPEIDDQLAQSFAVIVIITDASMKSHFVTYEWARAMGSSIPVIGIQIEPLKPRTRLHPVWAYSQYIKCEDGVVTDVIKDKLAVKLREYERESPLIDHVERTIGRELMALRILISGLLWMIRRFPHNNMPIEPLLVVRSLVNEEAYKAHTNKLPQYWLQYSHAFTRKLRRWHDEELIGATFILWKETSGNSDWNSMNIQSKLDTTRVSLEEYLYVIKRIVPAEQRLGVDHWEIFNQYLVYLETQSTPSVSNPIDFGNSLSGRDNGEAIARYYLTDEVATNLLASIHRVAKYSPSSNI